MNPSPTHPSRSPSPECEEDIAAAMGFASFGAKPNPPQKKRRLAGTDVDIEGSGSNNTPLGERVKSLQGVGPWRTEEEKGEKWEGDGQEQGGVGGGEEDCRGMKEMEKPTPLEDDVGVLTTSPTRSHVQPSYEQQQDPHSPVQDPEWERLLEEARQRGLRRLEQMGQGEGAGRRADGEWDWNALRRGLRDERGDMVFYDASFVEDPWRHLGRDRGGKGIATRPG